MHDPSQRDERPREQHLVFVAFVKCKFFSLDGQQQALGYQNFVAKLFESGGVISNRSPVLGIVPVSAPLPPQVADGPVKEKNRGQWVA